MTKTADILFDYLKNILYDSGQEPPDIDSLPADFQQLGQGLQFLSLCIKEEHEFLNALAKGDLSAEPPGADNPLAAPAKTLQAQLRHLQWQTKQIAKGDYSQRVDFMGEFSRDFNTMTTQLAARKAALLQEKQQIQQHSLKLKQNLDLMLTFTNYTHNKIFVFSACPVEQIFANQAAKWFMMSDPDTAELLIERLKAFRIGKDQQAANWEAMLETKEGRIYYTIETFIGYHSNELSIFHIVVNTTEQKEQEKFMHSLAYTDPLTGLKNRRYVMERMEELVRQKTPFLLSYIDVDYLKYCNDTFGHDHGDRYLIDVASLLRNLPCEACRIGGDEFILLNTADTDCRAWEQRISHLRDLLSHSKDTPYPRSFSFATTAVPAEPEKTLSEYLKITDDKMREYKLKHKPFLSDVLYRDERSL